MWPIRPISAYRPAAARKGPQISIIAVLRLLYHSTLRCGILAIFSVAALRRREKGRKISIIAVLRLLYHGALRCGILAIFSVAALRRREKGRKISIIAVLRLLYHGALPVTTAVFTGLHRIFSVFHCIFLPDVIKIKVY